MNVRINEEGTLGADFIVLRRSLRGLPSWTTMVEREELYAEERESKTLNVMDTIMFDGEQRN